ncbi:MAG: ABC transporter ATP-binding protein [Clostridium sp.]|nr:ABC transporter ATP-binding protein [Clostridium sp.]MDD7138924.1 ABC transporter ATP-binding protein [Clostridium sp.]
MPKIELKHVNKRWGGFYAVEDLNLSIDDAAFVTLLGPSGCGKTTTLRMIAGLETPTSGRIEIGDTVVFDSELGINIPPNKRKVGFLFQNYALWPNMTVYDNIAFGLSNIKSEMPRIDFEAKNTARLIELLKTPEDVVRQIEDCRTKKGTLDQKKAYIKLIDAYTISMFTAKELYRFDLQSAKDPGARAKELTEKLKAKLTAAQAAAKAKGLALNADFEFTKNGKVVTEVRKLTREEIDLSVRRVSRIVKISMFMDRYPAELSGGQQQRVAIARTLAPEPTVLFMDEPLSNLDAKLRLEMRYELQRLHLETGSTFVYVTHDQMEAMTLATRICLIDNGVLQQYAPPLTVYGAPENLFVADFVGNPAINFINAHGEQAADGSIRIRLLNDVEAKFIANEALDLPAWFRARDEAAANEAAARAARAKQKGYVEKSNKDEVFHCHIAKVVEDDDALLEEPVLTDGDFVLGIRPEFVVITEDGNLPGEIYGAMPTGMESTLKIRVGEYLLTSVAFGSSLFAIGTAVKLAFTGNDILLFDRKSGRRIACGQMEIL